MDEDTPVVVLLLLVLIPIALFTGITYGVLRERKEWHTNVPKQMDLLCDQCFEEGRK